MSDTIIGTAVLDKRESPEYLYVCCQCADGRVRPCSIPVYEKGTPKTLQTQWEYEIKGDTLHVTPSLNWVGVFHNEGSWRVKYVLYHQDDGTPTYRLKQLNQNVEVA